MVTLFFGLLFGGLFTALLWPITPSKNVRLVREEYHTLLTEVQYMSTENLLQALRVRCVAKGIPEDQFDDVYREFLEEKVRDER